MPLAIDTTVADYVLHGNARHVQLFSGGRVLKSWRQFDKIRTKL